MLGHAVIYAGCCTPILRTNCLYISLLTPAVRVAQYRMKESTLETRTRNFVEPIEVPIWLELIRMHIVIRI